LTKHDNQQNKYDTSGVYQLTCHDCNKRYVGQTGTFHVRFKEHVREYRYKNNKSKFSNISWKINTLLNLMENIMEILHTTTTGRMLNTLEKFYIYKETKNNNQINDRLTVTPNIIFDTTLRKSNDRALKVI
jgi:hypothetical protein